MNNIYKYKIGYGSQTLEIEGFIRALTVQVTQNEQAFIWVESSSDITLVSELRIDCYPTGEDVKLHNPNQVYVGSLFYRDGHYIEHVYVNLRS